MKSEERKSHWKIQNQRSTHALLARQSPCFEPCNEPDSLLSWRQKVFFSSFFGFGQMKNSPLWIPTTEEKEEEEAKKIYKIYLKRRKRGWKSRRRCWKTWIMCVRYERWSFGFVFAGMAGCTDSVCNFFCPYLCAAPSVWQCMAAIIFVPYSFWHGCHFVACASRAQSAIQRDYKRCKGALIRFILTVSAAVAVTWHVARLSVFSSHSLTHALFVRCFVHSMCWHATSAILFFFHAKWFYFSSNSLSFF